MLELLGFFIGQVITLFIIHLFELIRVSRKNKGWKGPIDIKITIPGISLIGCESKKADI